MSAVDTAQIISALGTVIAAIVALIAAMQSQRSAKQNNETNEQLIRPRVVVLVRSAEAATHLIDLVILNDGGGVARNIKLKVAKDNLSLDFQQAGIAKMTDLRVMKYGIAVLPAGSERKYFLLSLTNRLEEILQKKSVIKLQYTDATGMKKYNDIFVLDFASLSESNWTTDDMKAPKKIAEELKRIREVLARIS